MPDSSPDKPDLSTHPLVSKLVGIRHPAEPCRPGRVFRSVQEVGLDPTVHGPGLPVVFRDPEGVDRRHHPDGRDGRSEPDTRSREGRDLGGRGPDVHPVGRILPPGGHHQHVQFQGDSTGSQLGVVQPTPTAIPTNQVVCQIHPTPTAIPTNQVVCQIHPTPTAIPTNPVACQIHPTPTAIPTHQVYCYPTQQVVCQPNVTQAACGVGGLRESAQGIFVPTGPGPCTHSPACYLTNRPRGGNAC